MNRITQVLSIAAAAGVAYKVLTHKRSNGTTLLDGINETGRDWSGRISQYAGMIKDKLMPGMKGPNGEDVYTDMYKRSYYTTESGQRTYMDEIS